MADTSNTTGIVKLQVKVVPGAARSEVAGWLGERLKLRINAVPEKGKANAAVEALIAEALGLQKSAVRIIAGRISQLKTLEITGITESTIMQKLGRPKAVAKS